MRYYTKTVEETFRELDVSIDGLSNIEALERLSEYGPNVIKTEGESVWRKIIEPFRNIFMLLLSVAVVISFFHHAFVDAVIILIIIFASAAIYYVQQFTTGRVLRSLKKHDALFVEVVRDKKTITIEASDIVPGDIIMLNEGEKIPADARLINSSSLRIDESLLTGESFPIEKQTDRLFGDKEAYEQSNMVFQGSYVVGGEAAAIVTSTGNNTEFGHIALLSTENFDKSPVQVRVDKLVKQLIYIILIVATLAFVLSIYRGMSLSDSLRFIIALSVSAVPESLPVAISVVLVFGMRRMAAKKALVKTMAAIETIGTVTTVATDKTGTLTKNKLTVQEVYSANSETNVLDKSIAMSINLRNKKINDPLDKALNDFVDSKNIPTASANSQQKTVFPFSHTISMSGNLWKENDHYCLYVKGAPEKLLDICKLDRAQRFEAESQLHRLTSNGYRVIALAHKNYNFHSDDIAKLIESKGLLFDGLVAIEDELRPESHTAIKKALQAGVTVRMITGDHFDTAFHIGKKLGMVGSRNQVFDSRKMHHMSDEELEKVIDDIRVFSRVVPEQKHRILAILKKHNITAMTGDGVNDAPALANAHVGLAMGSGATIAKDAGDIILIDDNFKSIVSAIHEGRTIYANIKRMLVYLLSTNTGEVIVSLGALVMGMPIALLPVQILWVNLVTDTSLVIPLGLEPGEKRNMFKRPQSPKAPLLSHFMISRIMLIASTMGVVTLALYVIFYNHSGLDYARSIAFNALVVMQWASALCARSDYEPLYKRIKRLNKPFIIGLSIAIGLQLLVLFSSLGEYLHLVKLETNDLVFTSLAAFIIPLVIIEIHKYIGRRYFHKGSLIKPVPTSVVN